ncbi:MAG: TolC family protein [bacterium]|nr:TolC family protein [bacterium]
MNIKKFIAASLIAGMVGTNFFPVTALAIGDKKEVQTQKLSRKEKKALEAKTNKLDYINIDWWESYNDKYLSNYILRAVENNPDMKIATLKVEEARQAAKLQLANELPQVSVGASPAIIKQPGKTKTTGVFSIPIVASYEADIFLKNHDKTKSAKKIYEASQYQEQAAYLAIASQVGAVYYNIVKIDKLIELQEEIISDRKQIYDMMKLSNEEGIVSTSDLVKADKSYVQSTTDLIELKKAREVLLNTLAVLIGENPNNSADLKRISYDEIVNLKAVPNEISSEVITERPDYLVAQKMIEKAGIDVRVAKKEFLPTFDILGLLGFSATSMPGLKAMNWQNAVAGAGAQALLPVFTGGARIANFKINKNRYEQAVVNYQKTNLTAIQEVNDTLSTLKLDNEKYDKNLKTLDMEKKDFGFTEAKYNEGVISKLDLLQRKENLLVVEKMVVASKAECLVNQISLYKALAGKV